jgi:hypothetical protein
VAESNRRGGVLLPRKTAAARSQPRFSPRKVPATTSRRDEPKLPVGPLRRHRWSRELNPVGSVHPGSSCRSPHALVIRGGHSCGSPCPPLHQIARGRRPYGHLASVAPELLAPPRPATARPNRTFAEPSPVVLWRSFRQPPLCRRNARRLSSPPRGDEPWPAEIRSAREGLIHSAVSAGFLLKMHSTKETASARSADSGHGSVARRTRSRTTSCPRHRISILNCLR